MSRQMQDRFAAALLNPESPVPPGLESWTGTEPPRRFGVYRNNVMQGLIGALASRFPATEKIVGRAFFTAMAEAYIGEHPPRSPVLLAYGEDFANFAAGFEPASGLVYLPDVMRLEAARSRAYHAADAVPLTADAFAAIPTPHLPDVVLTPHPSLSILRSASPVVLIWAMNSGEVEPAPLTAWPAEDALIVRPHMLVEVHRLPPGGAVFLQMLADGLTLGRAIEAALVDAPAFDLPHNLAGLIHSGSFISLRLEEPADAC